MPEKITSRENQKVKFARSVRDGKEPEFIFIEGVRLVEEALRSDIRVHQALVAESFTEKERNRELIESFAAGKIEIFELSERIFQSIAETVNTQGIILLARRPESALGKIESRLSETGTLPLVLFLHEINNPANLGAILRTSEAAGIAGVIISPRSADVFSPKSLRASMGSAFRLPVVDGLAIEKILAWADASGLVSTAADVGASTPHTAVDWGKPRLLVFGSEGHGLSRTYLEHIRELTFIPMQNRVESLNLAVSCGIILFEAVRQNSRP